MTSHVQALSSGSNLGEQLSETRLRRGWSLQDVEAQTRIPVTVLRQLEADNYTGPLSGPYGRSFLFQYADRLGIDVFDALKTIDAEEGFNKLDSCEYLKDHDEYVSGAPIGYWFDPREDDEEFETESTPKLRSRAAAPVMATLFTAILIAAALLGYMRLDRAFSESNENDQSSASRGEVLAPLAGIPDSGLRSAASRAPTLVSFNPQPAPEREQSDLVTGSPLESTHLASANSPVSSVSSRREVSIVQTTSARALDQAPPRAIIVEE